MLRAGPRVIFCSASARSSAPTALSSCHAVAFEPPLEVRVGEDRPLRLEFERRARGKRHLRLEAPLERVAHTRHALDIARVDLRFEERIWNGDRGRLPEEQLRGQVIDSHEPEERAYDLCQRLTSHELTRGIPVIAVTAWSVGGHVERARRAGCDAVLLKPCLPELLLAESHRLLGLSQSGTMELSSR